ncbi:LRRC46 isoform 3 [Pongo abelii]|uniref:LRRC46 isoform 3 n=1 Tax=Pongo abelii TaxID=9601 RepID=A0A2J8W9I0_PONAB|nr:LRRC46 isoform 3 [Pongo abelii]
MSGGKSAQGPEEGGVCITEALITKRNLTFPEDEELSEKMFHTLDVLQTVRLDREGITTIRNLEGLQNLHSLYLQGLQPISCFEEEETMKIPLHHSDPT